MIFVFLSHLFVIKINNANNLMQFFIAMSYIILFSYNNYRFFNSYNFFNLILIYFFYIISFNVKIKSFIFLRLNNIEKNNKILILRAIYKYVVVIMIDLMIFFFFYKF